MNIKDVANAAGVSPATVSRVLNGELTVSEVLRAQVEQAVRDLNFVRDAHARALRATSTGVVGVIIHDVSDPYFGEIVAGIQEVASESRRLVVLCDSHRDADAEPRYLELLRGQRVDAVILAGGAIEDPAYLEALSHQAQAIEQQGGRLVLCGRYPVEADAVVPDNAGGAAALTRFLIGRGHTAIAEITGPLHFSTTTQRTSGHRGALREAGIERPSELVATGDFSRDGGYAATRELLGSGQTFSAIFAANDLMAVGALAALREAGLRVPDDVSVVGFDDVPTVRDVCPALTTARVPMREMGRRCMRLALSSAGSGPRVDTLEVEVVERESVR